MSNNIINFNKDAEFFFNRGHLSFEKGDYLKTLRYFRRMVEMEPQNANYRFYLAEVLTEVGRFKESNEMLQYNVEVVDPTLAECYFAMGCNYFALQLFTKAQKSLDIYLKSDNNTGYRDEALEVMRVLQMQEGYFHEEYPNYKIEDIKYFYHLIDQGRYQLLLGNYEKAIPFLREVAEKIPELITIKNDLCFAYYYVGEYEASYNISNDILKRNKDNLDAKCFCILNAQALGEKPIVARLKHEILRLNPTTMESRFMLGWVLGQLGDHEKAYHLMRSVKKTTPYLSKPLHFLGIAALHCRRYDEALGAWRRLEKIEPENALCGYYIEEVQRIKRGETEFKIYPYDYELPEAEKGVRLKTLEKMTLLSYEELNRAIERNEYLKRILEWGLLNPKAVIREKALDIIHHYPMPLFEEMIRRFILRMDIDDETKKSSFAFLNKIQASEPYLVYLNGHFSKIETSSTQKYHTKILTPTFEQVLNLTLEKMASRYEEEFKRDIWLIWTSFVEQSGPRAPRIKKLESWAAALEYCFCRLHRLDITQKQLSGIYGVSAATISQRFQDMNHILDMRMMGANINGNE